MKAVKCTKYGPPGVLKIVDIGKLKPKSNEILIRNYYTTVTVADCRVRGFNVPSHFWLPARLILGMFRPRRSILGGELAGIIEDVGKNVSKYKIGDKVFAFTSKNFGANAEYTRMNENKCIALMPPDFGFGQSAALSFGGITALHFLEKSKIKANEKVLIYGASGGVGTYAVQLAKYFGAVVTGVCSTDNTELVKNIGADCVIDYTKTDLADINEKYDVFFDTVGKADISKSIQLIKPNGRYLHAVTDPSTNEKIKSELSGKNIAFSGGTYKANARQINFIGKLAAEGKIKPVIDRIYNLDEIVAAHEYVEKGHKKGNVLIKIMDE